MSTIASIAWPERDGTDDPLPRRVTATGLVTSLEWIAPDIAEIVIAFPRRFDYRPGQWVDVAFEGVAPGDHCPTVRRDGWADLNEIVLHVRHRAEGVGISAEVGRTVAAGHPVRVRGPFGTVCHRLGRGRLILVSSDEGFAPVWAIARASRMREPDRPLVVVAGIRDPASLFVQDPMRWLKERGAVTRLTCEALGRDRDDVLAGRPILHLPRMNADDTVMAFGEKSLVAAVTFLATMAGATCHTHAIPGDGGSTR